MSIEQHIRQIAEGMGLPYFLGSYPIIDKTMDFILSKAPQYPVCLNIQSVSGRVDLADGMYFSSIRRTQSLTIAFAEPISFDYDATQAERKVENLTTLGAQMIQKLNESGKYEQVPGATTLVGFDEFDANLLLVLFTFDLTELQGTCIE